MLDHAGKTLSLPIKSEETGNTTQVERWGLRVDKEVFDSVARDKLDNGIIERNVFGYKSRGHLVPEYNIPTTAGAITRW